jgi:4-amino-4-deoxy-L-arabinose transferase-like glycosyltransferase
MNKNTFFTLLAACIGVYLIGSIAIPLMDIDAAQYASISREMIERNSYLQVFDLGKDYLDKPPMLFWLSAFSMKIFGVHDWAYRFPSLIFLGLALYATYQFTALYYHKQTARLATIILASSQAFFLIAHDVRTDTMLVGWVMLTIYLLAKWTENNRTLDFFLAIMTIAGGMMTKGPIAFVVPVLCFIPQWLSQKKWAYFYKPIYILGLLLLACFLFPMSWGLYQQYDLHPGKLINQIPISSGLKFYYWTQSFGRYTGENYYHEMSHFTFLLENMLWSFLPWIFVFLWALVCKAKQLIKQGFFQQKGELISFFGFVLTYLVLSRSQAQLPHYIFIVFPLAAILTAAHWDQIVWNAKTVSGWVKAFYGFHLFIFLILIIAVGGIAIIPFGVIGIVGKIGCIAMLVVLIILLRSKQLLGQKWFYISVILIVGVNFVMNTHFYPHLLQFQWGNQLAKVVNEKGWDKQKIVSYKIPNSNAFHFYGQHVFPNVSDSLTLTTGEYVVTDSINFKALQQQFPKSEIVYQSQRFHVTLLTFTFLNPATRNQETTPFGVMRLAN